MSMSHQDPTYGKSYSDQDSCDSVTSNLVKEVAIYTAIFADYDNLKEPDNPILNADLYCFTDNPNLTSNFFNVIHVSLPLPDPVRSARKYKILGHPIVNKYHYSIWFDAAFRLKFTDALEVIRKCLPEENDYLAAVKNAKKNCIYQEYEYIKTVNNKPRFLDHQYIMDRQIETYRQEGYPENNGLISSGFLIKNNRSKDLQELMQAWWQEIEKFSRRDQLSFNYVVWKLQKKYRALDINIWDNEFVKWDPHLALPPAPI